VVHQNQACQAEASIWFEIWGVVDMGLKTGWSWVIKVQQMEACSTWLRVSSPEFLFNYTQIILFLFLKNHHFVKSYHLISLYIMGHNNISWRPNYPSPKQQNVQDWRLYCQVNVHVRHWTKFPYSRLETCAVRIILWSLNLTKLWTVLLLESKRRMYAHNLTWNFGSILIANGENAKHFGRFAHI